jgi:hypothetical protein
MLQAFGTFFCVCLQIIDDSAVIKIAEMADKINRKNGERETKNRMLVPSARTSDAVRVRGSGKFNTGALKGTQRFDQEFRIISPLFLKFQANRVA